MPSRLLMRGSLLSLCAVVFLAGGVRDAWATCGDYLHGHGSHMSGHSEMNSDESLDAFAGLRRARPAEKPPGPACSGPHCQQDQQKPATPGKAVQVPNFHDAVLSAISTVIRVEDSARSLPPEADLVTGLAGRIFRPPRATC